MVFGSFARGARYEKERMKNFLSNSRLSETDLRGTSGIGMLRSCENLGELRAIDPSAVIKGPTTIGDNVTIYAGAVIDNSIIGSNVNISQDVQVMLSVIGDELLAFPRRIVYDHHNG